MIVAIVDHGIGIPDEELESIFLPFKRATNARYKGGYGIGLYLVTKILELHDAKLSVVSKLNEGSSFQIIINRF